MKDFDKLKNVVQRDLSIMKYILEKSQYAMSANEIESLSYVLTKMKEQFSAESYDKTLNDWMGLAKTPNNHNDLALSIAFNAVKFVTQDSSVCDEDKKLIRKTWDNILYAHKEKKNIKFEIIPSHYACEWLNADS